MAIRLAGLPVDHMVAELSAFPLVSEIAARLSITQLHSGLAAGTAELWRGAEKHLVHSFPGLSLDEAVALRDKYWFANLKNQPLELQNYLQRLAHGTLEVHGSVATPK